MGELEWCTQFFLTGGCNLRFPTPSVVINPPSIFERWVVQPVKSQGFLGFKSCTNFVFESFTLRCSLLVFSWRNFSTHPKTKLMARQCFSTPGTTRKAQPHEALGCIMLRMEKTHSQADLKDSCSEMDFTYTPTILT